MQLRAPIQLRSMIKSLKDTVLPAVNPDNKPALEQAQLILAMLQLLETRAPMQHRFDCDELARLLAYTRQLQGLVDTTAGGALEDEIADAQKVLNAAQSCDPAQVPAAVHRLRAVGANALERGYEAGGADERARLRDWVFEWSGAQLLRDRAWVLDQGWEPDPEKIPPIDTLLR